MSCYSCQLQLWINIRIYVFIQFRVVEFPISLPWPQIPSKWFKWYGQKTSWMNDIIQAIFVGSSICSLALGSQCISICSWLWDWSTTEERLQYTFQITYDIHETRKITNKKMITIITVRIPSYTSFTFTFVICFVLFLILLLKENILLWIGLFQNLKFALSSSKDN